MPCRLGYQPRVSSRPVSAAFREQAEALRRGARVSLADVALVLAADLHDDVDTAAAHRELDRLGMLARVRLEREEGLEAKAGALLDVLTEQGFRGNRNAYEDPRNSFLDQVLARRTGIPITLAIVAIETGARAGLELDGVSFPGHFLVRTPSEPPVILDAFEGSLVSVVDCERRLKAALGPAAVLDPALLGAASAREILVRMLGNLKNGFLGEGDWISAIDCCDRLILVAPELVSELRDRGILWTRLGFVAPAIEDLEHYLERVPGAPEADQLRQELVRLKAEDVTLH